MPFQAICSHCPKSFTARDLYEGKCSACGNSFPVLRPDGLVVEDDVATIQPGAGAHALACVGMKSTGIPSVMSDRVEFSELQ